jgi:hypothetical protein
MPRSKVFAEDTALPLRIRVGTIEQPQPLSGITAAIRLKNLNTNAQITSGTTTVETPASDGIVRRAWQSGELVVGTVYAVEVLLTFPGESAPRAFPGPDDPALEVEVVARRTAV